MDISLQTSELSLRMIGHLNVTLVCAHGL
ncbi:hypothetical protein RSAG8_03579, partial [Rhizoctonia solani AG-8 WAC10335]